MCLRVFQYYNSNDAVAASKRKCYRSECKWQKMFPPLLENIAFSLQNKSSLLLAEQMAQYSLGKQDIEKVPGGSKKKGRGFQLDCSHRQS